MIPTRNIWTPASIVLAVILLLNPAWAADENDKDIAALGVIRITGAINEGPGLTLWSLTGEESNGLLELHDRINQAGDDSGLEGLLLSIENPSLSWAQVDELRATITRCRDKGKKVFAYLEAADMSDYLLAAACDEIVMSPVGAVDLVGLSLRPVYYRELLEKIGIQADMLQVGDYKGAVEPMTLSGPSPQMQQQLHHLLDGLYEHLLESMAQSRGLSTDQTADLIDNGPYTSKQALKAGLIDQIMYRSDYLDYLGDKQDKVLLLKSDYGMKSAAAPDMSNPFSLMTTLNQMFNAGPRPSGPVVAVVYIDGVIVSGSSGEGWDGKVVGSRTVRMALASAQNDPDVKAIVLRVDSPGGDAIASDIINHAAYNIWHGEESAINKPDEEESKETPPADNAANPQTTAEENTPESAADEEEDEDEAPALITKPVIASMGGVAASGGYYVAVGAETIFAEPGTITGSIGVMGGKIVLSELFDMLGIRTYGVSRGRHAEIDSSMQTFTLSERRHQQTIMQEIYDDFKNAVLRTRDGKLQKNIEQLAQGRIYTGRQAMREGLVDDIGGLHDAIAFAAAEARKRGLLGENQKYEILHLPRPMTLGDLLERLMVMSPAIRNNLPGGFHAGIVPTAAEPFSSSLPAILPEVRQLYRAAHLWGQLFEHNRMVVLMPWIFIHDGR